jgi:hypothetical protein
MNERNIFADYLGEVDHQLSRYHQLLVATNDKSPDADHAIQQVEDFQRGMTQRIEAANASFSKAEFHQSLEAKLAVGRVRQIIDLAADRVDSGQEIFPWNDALLRELSQTLIVFGPDNALPPAPPSPSTGRRPEQAQDADNPHWFRSLGD